MGEGPPGGGPISSGAGVFGGEYGPLGGGPSGLGAGSEGARAWGAGVASGLGCVPACFCLSSSLSMSAAA